MTEHPKGERMTTGPAPITERVAEAMSLLGAAWRGDWSDFDGRTLRSQLDTLAAALTDPDSPFDAASWAHAEGICPISRSWHEHCIEPMTGEGGWSSCGHYDAYLAEHSASGGGS